VDNIFEIIIAVSLFLIFLITYLFTRLITTILLVGIIVIVGGICYLVLNKYDQIKLKKIKKKYTEELDESRK